MTDKPKTIQEALAEVQRNAAQIKEQQSDSILSRTGSFVKRLPGAAVDYGKSLAGAAADIAKGAPQAVSSTQGLQAAIRGGIHGLTGRTEPVSPKETTQQQQALADVFARRLRRPEIAQNVANTEIGRAHV